MSSTDNQDSYEDDDFCDIGDFAAGNQNNVIFHYAESQESPTHQVLFSEESLKEDIQKVDQLRSDEVRWFYLSSKTKQWKAFQGFDSLQIEKEWRKTSTDTAHEKVCVRGGMFEVDVSLMKCFPVYWSSDETSVKTPNYTVDVLRGTWFFEVNWQPLDEVTASRLEKEHLARWRGYNVDHIKELMNNKVMHSVQLDGSHVEWNSVTDILFYKDATAHRALRNIVQKFGVSKATSSGYRLQRGYKEDAMIEDIFPPIDNIVFVIHGVGAKSDRCKIVRNTGSFRSACHQLEHKHFSGRTEFIPVEWRSELKLDGDMMEHITPKKGQGMRKFVNNTAMDILYYTSPLFRTEIINGLRSRLNKLFAMFSCRNKSFNGKIVVFAHSLGSVLFFDILTNYVPSGHETLPSSNARHPVKPKLVFKPDMLFCVGSPLGMFLCLRGFRPGVFSDDDRKYIVPASVCRRIYNIYHPADPVAYRVEPVFCKSYAEILPFQISSVTALTKAPRPASPSPTRAPKVTSHGENDETVVDHQSDASNPSSPEIHRSSSYLRSVSDAVTGSAVRLGRGLWSKARGSSPEAPQPPTEPPSSSSVTPERRDVIVDVELDERIDYELPEGFTERKLGYASFTSHTSYWTNQDLGMFLLTKLHGDLDAVDKKAVGSS